MSEYLGALEVVDVELDETGVVLTFLYEEAGEIRTVKFNRKKYDPQVNKWKTDKEQEERFQNNIRDLLHTTEDELGHLIGQKFDVWDAERYSALWEPKEFHKFDASMIGQIVQAELVEINVYDAKAQLVFDYSGDQYISNINWGQYVPSLKKSLPNPVKKTKQLAKFQTKFHVPFENRDELIGKKFMLEVKANNLDTTGKNPTYIDVKALPR